MTTFPTHAGPQLEPVLTSPNTAAAATASTDHYLVGIGASAGGLEAIHQLFDHFPSNSSFSFVIIQHLSPDHKSLMAELLSKHTCMRVQEAEDGMVTHPNCVYLLPNGQQLTLERGRLRLQSKPRNRQPNFAIDLFLESLARDRGCYAIGVILSGTGTDGTKGAKAIKEAGGMVVVQDPLTAKFDGMPRSVLEAGRVDFVSSPERMPNEIIDYTKKIPLIRTLAELKVPETDSEVLEEILSLICTETVHDFKNYKQATIHRRIHKRMRQLDLNELTAYLSYLQGNPAEIKLLCQELLIGVTKFFRDPQAFAYLEGEVIPKILAGKPSGEPVKVWVAGCSTGEEAYSLAILFAESFAMAGREPLLKIFATDVDPRAISRASKGSYPVAIDRDVSRERLERYFLRQGNRYMVGEAIRKLVVFAGHDVQKDPPFSRLDMISCRNMLIYLNADLQGKVLSTFCYNLNVNGYLFLGPSEQPGESKAYLEEEHRKWKVYRKYKESPPARNSFGAARFFPIQPLASPVNRSSPPGIAAYQDSFMDAVAEDFCLAGLYVDENHQLLHGIGQLSHFIKFPEKRLHFNLLKMVPQPLAVALSVGVRQVAKQAEKVVIRRVKIPEGKITRQLQMSVRLVAAPHFPGKVFLILLREEARKKTLALDNAELPITYSGADTQETVRLKSELKEARENLHLAIEDLGTSNEELQSANEELISANEELQSTNEELQSLNEELHTVNAEHQLKIKELLELNEDLDNYNRSSSIGKLFVDHHLRIRRFTPSIQGLVNIIDSDVGRPLHHLSHNMRYDRWVEDIRQVNHSAKELEREVETSEGKYFLMRILPYLKRDGNQDGVVISFVDITALQALHHQIEGVLNSSVSSIMALSAQRAEGKVVDFTFSLLNHRAEAFLGTTLAAIGGQSVLKLMPFLKPGGLFKKWIHVLHSGMPLHTEYYLDSGTAPGWYEIIAVPTGVGLAVTFNDITARKPAEEKAAQAYEKLKQAEENLVRLNEDLEGRVRERTEALSRSEERFRLISMATNDVVWDWNLVTGELWWNEGLQTILGYASSRMEQGVNGWFEKIHPQERERVVKGIHQAINRGGQQWSDEYQMLKASGEFAHVYNRAYLLHNEYGMPYRMLGSFIDITGLKTAQQELQRSNEQLLRINADLDNFVYSASHDLKAPISNIEGLIIMLERKLKLPESVTTSEMAPTAEAATGVQSLLNGQVPTLFELIKQSINRFKQTVRDLAEVAKVQKNVDGESAEVSLEEVLTDIKVNIREVIREADARIEADFTAVPTLHFSRKNLYSILYNLVSNAIKYRALDRAPFVSLRIERLEDQVRLTVADNGLGISQEDLPKLFSMFKRFHTHVEGTGIGLYIVKRIIDNAGGKIEISSEEGKGTVCTIYFKQHFVSSSYGQEIQ